MTRRIWLIIALIFGASAVTAGVLHFRAAQWSHVDAKLLVAQALSQDNRATYVADVVTRSGYNGEVSETHATVYHRGNVEKIRYAGASDHSPWSMKKDGKSYAYLPKEHKVLVTEMSRLLSDDERAKLLLSNFTVNCVGIDAIAGRAAYVVELTSRGSDRPSKKLWIDRSNQAILRTDDYSASGEKRGSTEMVKVNFDARIDSELLALPSNKSVKFVMLCKSGDSAALFKGLGFPVSMPRYLPEGYKLEGYHLLSSSCTCGHHSAQLTYTDGLNVISVFQTPRMISCCATTSGATCDDQNCGIATQGQVTRGDKTVVVVGDLLPKEIRKISASVR